MEGSEGRSECRLVYRRVQRRWFCRGGVLAGGCHGGVCRIVSFKCLGGVGGESKDVGVIAVGHDEARWEFFLELVEDGLEGHAVEEAAPATALPTFPGGISLANFWNSKTPYITGFS